jgi:hypothetical protein
MWLASGVPALVAAKEDRVQNHEPPREARAPAIGRKSTRPQEGRARRPNRLSGAQGERFRFWAGPESTILPARFVKPEESAMPWHFCHMEAPHKKLRLPEWYVSSLMMDRALDAVVRRVKKLDRKHDIPYLAGYSRDGKTIYIDRHMPPSFRYRGRDIDTDRFLILHEEVEKTLIDQLDLHYLHAHQIATRAEQAALRAAGIEWRAYDRFMQQHVKTIGDERLTNVPADLDEKPYRDEHDTDLLRRMNAAIEKSQVPKDIGKTRAREAADRLKDHIAQRRKTRGRRKTDKK